MCLKIKNEKSENPKGWDIEAQKYEAIFFFFLQRASYYKSLLII